MTQPEHTNQQPAAIRVQDARFSYGKKTAFEHLDLTIQSGDFFALLGRNGAGKSSLVNCLMGFFEPQQGTVEVLGHNVWRHRHTLMNDVALVPESPNVPLTMTPRTAARFCARLGQPGRFDHGLFKALLEEGDVPPGKAFRSLSRGQKTQVTLALALAARPRVLVLDDPTLGLDAVARRRIYRALIELQTMQEVTIFMTTHDLAAVDGLATHVGFLRQGTLMESGEVAQLKARYRIANLARRQPLEDLPGTIVRENNNPLGYQVLLALDEPTQAVSLPDPWTVPTVEELFLALLDEPGTEGPSPDLADSPHSLRRVS